LRFGLRAANQHIATCEIAGGVTVGEAGARAESAARTAEAYYPDPRICGVAFHDVGDARQHR
jgi:hypothetical protein